MKFVQIEKTIVDNQNTVSWRENIMKPLLLGVTFGTGCYIAKILLNSPLLREIMEMGEKGASAKLQP